MPGGQLLTVVVLLSHQQLPQLLGAQDNSHVADEAEDAVKSLLGDVIMQAKR